MKKTKMNEPRWSRVGSPRVRVRRRSELDGRIVALVATFTIVSIVAVAGILNFMLPPQDRGRSIDPNSSGNPAAIGLAGRPAFTILEGNTYTIATAVSNADNLILNQFTLNAPISTAIRIDLSDHYNGTLTIPPGATVKVTIGSLSYQIQDPDFPPNKSNPLITVSSGNTPIRYAVTFPSSTRAGTYKFSFEIYSFRDSTASFMTWGNYFQVSVVVS